ncbi:MULTISPECIES: glycerophosphodiester phosphodiesterase family protein [Bacillus]|uniref:glycerophosphodiester phosphodiesterase family protein n=1 Tax=Bacillus TaxID=1386 RepID=UPI00066FDEAB|nr:MULTISPECIES: glycerophosphodiester phosphodiesterase family protein [Bacillus]UZD73188.1 glycerophosphodiester phosphodiesterase family protein [Bacillus siamensis]
MKKLKYLVIIGLISMTGGCSVIHASAGYHPVLIAHRGSSAIEPEHTALSYARAIKDKADYIEIDLRETKDGHLIAIHDKTVDRTTDGKGLTEDLSLAEIKKLNAGKGEKILTIEEIIEKFGQTANYYIETRESNGSLVMEKKLIDILQKYKLISSHKAVIESFSEKSLKKVRSMNKSVPLVRLLKDKEAENINDKQLQAIRTYADTVGLNAKLTNEAAVKRIHHNKMKVHVFFDKEDERALTPIMLKQKVDGVFTNNPAYTRNVLQKQ